MADEEGAQLQELADQIKRPSRVIFLIVVSIVGLADLVDIIAGIVFIFTLGASTPVSEGASLVIDLIVLIVLLISGYISSRHLKKAQHYQESVGKSVQMMEQRIAKFRQRYAFTLRLGRKIPFLRRPLAKVALKMRAAKLLSTKSPIGRFLTRTVLDFIPIISMWPFRTIAVVQTYKAEKEAYERKEEIHDSWMMANAAEVAEEEQLLELGEELEEEEQEEKLVA